jgi:hypothetical protein
MLGCESQISQSMVYFLYFFQGFKMGKKRSRRTHVIRSGKCHEARKTTNHELTMSSQKDVPTRMTRTQKATRAMV